MVRKTGMVVESPTPPASVIGEPDAIALIKNDHQKVDGLFTSFERTGPGEQSERRRIVDEVITELSVHASIEEQVFYPAVRRALPEGHTLVSESIDEHREMKEKLARLQGMDPSAAVFHPTVMGLIGDVRHHVREEENDILARLQQAIDRDQLMDIGRQMERAKASAPTRPQPGDSPTTQPGNVLGGTAQPMDRAREGISGLVGS